MGRSHDVVSIIFKAGGVPALLILVERKKKVASKRDILEECSFWGYFDLKARFLSRGMEVPLRVETQLSHPFNLAFRKYYNSCNAVVKQHKPVMLSKRRLARFSRRALCGGVNSFQSGFPLMRCTTTRGLP